MNLRAQSVTIGIVEDQPLYRNMLAVALSTDPQFNVMWAVGTVAEARNALNSQRPAVLILDIDLPDGNGVALGVTVRRHLPHIGIPAAICARRYGSATGSARRRPQWMVLPV